MFGTIRLFAARGLMKGWGCVLDFMGLDDFVAAVYQLLVQYPHADVTELSDRLGFSGEQIRDALDRLSALALVRRLDASPATFRAVDPTLGIETLIAKEQERLAAEQERIEKLRRASALLSAGFAAARADRVVDGVERLDGIDEIRDRLAVLARDVTSELVALVPGGGVSEASRNASAADDEALLGRGVRMRTVYLDSVRHHAPTRAYAEWLTALGAEVRTVPTMPIRLVLQDRRVAVVPVDAENTAAGALVLNGNGTVTALCALFESVWEKGVPLGESYTRETDDRDLTPQEAEALRLLAQGHTDESVAKRLGVSPRTARRIASTLIEKLDARSRFQAGVRAAALGWAIGDE